MIVSHADYSHRLGPDVKFYAILSLGTQFRLVSLTPVFRASDQHQKDVIVMPFIEPLRLPQSSEPVSSKTSPITSSSWERSMTFAFPLFPSFLGGTDTQLPSLTIPSNFKSRSNSCYPQQNRLLSLARTGGGQTNLVKFVRQYYPELHGICAISGHAPALLAYERLPGGWYGVAMEYRTDAIPITMHDCISEHFERWKTDLQELVARFHDEGFVHGDLRDANILSGDDGCVKLVDFDWGGRDGEVSYPTPRLNRELVDGRSSEGLRIMKADDLRILNNTRRHKSHCDSISSLHHVLPSVAFPV